MILLFSELYLERSVHKYLQQANLLQNKLEVFLEKSKEYKVC